MAFDSPEKSLGMQASNETRLKVLIQTLKDFLPQYHGVEWIKETARHAANLAQVDSQSMPRASGESLKDWTQFLDCQPVLYLKLVLTIDMCISKGRLPEEQDFPSWFHLQLSAIKRSNPYSWEREPQTAAMTNETVLGPRLDYHTAQRVHINPSLPEPIPHCDFSAERHGGILGGQVDVYRPSIFEGLMTFDEVLGGNEYFGRDLDGMEWADHGTQGWP